MNVNPYESPETKGELPEQPTGQWKRWLLKVLTVGGILMVLVALLLPTQRRATEAGRRSSCANNLKQIGLALLNYHDEYKSFPPAYTVDATGKPLHSWRTLILPYLEQRALYERIDLSKPWDDPANKLAYDTEIPTYRCPSAAYPERHTAYLAVVAPHSCFPAHGSRSFPEMTDGTDGTLAVIECAAGHAVHWMSPVDASETMVMNFGAAKQLPHASGAQALFASGDVRFLSAQLKPATLRAMISIAGGEDVTAE